MLFNGCKEECQELVDWLNSLMPGVVRFKFEFSFDKIEFLDLEISVKDGKLDTNIYVKPTNKQLFLDFQSNHPQHCKESIPYSQALRLVERCATPENREIALNNLKSKFEERKYPTDLLEKQFDRAKSNDRKKLIFQNRKKKNQKDEKIRLMVTHNLTNPPLHKWIRDCKYLLARNEKAKAMGERIQICTRQPKNLQRLVGGFRGEPRVGQKMPPDAGCYKCNRCKVSCPIINESKVFQSTSTGKTYRIRQKLDCTSAWVIYLSTCKKCKGQYVGKSKNPFKKRHSGHKQEIKNEIGGLGHHYGGRGGCGYQNASFQIIEEIETKTMEFLAERETYWQHQLRVYVENGSRNHCYRKDL